MGRNELKRAERAGKPHLPDGGQGRSCRRAGVYPSRAADRCRQLRAELLEQRWLLSGIESLPDGGALDESPLSTPLYAAIPADAAGDASDNFRWSGWQASSPNTPGSYEATLEYAFQGLPVLHGPRDAATVSLAGEELWQVVGDPVLPMRTSGILLPQGSELASLSVNLGPGTQVAIGVNLAAATVESPLVEMAGATCDGCATHGEGGTFYGSFPQAPGLEYASRVMCGYRFAQLYLFPVEYDDPTDSLIYHSTISVTLSTVTAADASSTRVRALPSDRERVAGLVDNDSALWDYQAEPARGPESGSLPAGGPYEYVVITNSDLADEFQPLIDHKAERGLTAGIVTTEYIDSHFTGIDAAGDLPDKIRDFIRAAYNTWNTEWVLLGGDTDGYDVAAGSANSVVPHRGAKGGWDYDPPSIDNHMPTEVYFACLDGTWNGDGDAIWGEKNDGHGGGDVDLAPEILLGRAPVSNATEATQFVNKTIQYGTYPSPNPEWAVFLGEYLAPGLWGGDWGDAIDAYAHISTPPNDWTVTERYDRDAAWTTADFVGDLNANVHLVHHVGHSDETGNAKLDNSDVDGLTNTHPYFMYSAGCLSGAFDWNDAIAEHHVKGAHGAVGVVMNSRLGRNINMNSADYMMDRDFWYAMFMLGRRRFGEAHDYARSQSIPPPSSVSVRWQYFVCTLFADPETAVSLPGPAGAFDGAVYEDINGSRERDSYEPGLPGWEIFVDVDNDGVPDQQTVAGWSNDTPKSLPDVATTRSTIEVSGVTGRVLDVDVWLAIEHSYNADLDVYLESTSGRRVELFTDVGGDSTGFDDTRLDDEASTSITAGTAPFSGYFRPEGLLAEFDGQDPNGLWTLEITDDAGADEGQLLSWSVHLVCGDPSTVSIGNGHYGLENLLPGDYVVRQQLPSGWMQTQPPRSGPHWIGVPSGGVVHEVNFGNAQPTAIYGTKWHDLDGDGAQDFGEPRLADTGVYLDLNNNGVPDGEDPVSWTDLNGNYEFDGLLPGSYLVRELVSPGWVRTYPNDEVLFGVAPYLEEGHLFVIDPNHGGAYPVGHAGAEALVGLTSDGAGALYTIPNSGFASRALHSVNPITGSTLR